VAVHDVAIHLVLERVAGRDDPTALALGAFGIAMVEHDRVIAFEGFERALALSPSSSY
jgi:hypothetical protein